MKLDVVRLRPPAVGALAFMIVLLVQALGHTAMIILEDALGPRYTYVNATVVGLAGAILVTVGTIRGTERAGTWLGFFGGTLLWTGWVEFSFHYFSRHLGIPPLRENGEIITKPEYLMMPSSVGLLSALALFFLLNRETRCHAFLWLRKRLHLRVGEPTRQYRRNFSVITATETISVTWFFYVYLLLVYDESILGDRHWATYLSLFAFAVWALYLTSRLLRFTRMPSAIRYAIPTAIIAWNVVEILGRWRFLEEIWIRPWHHRFEMMLMGAALLAFVGVSLVTRRSSRCVEADG